MKNQIVSAIGATILALGATPAVAEELQSAVVSYADLDIATPEGVQTLNTRIDQAINRVCYTPSSRAISQYRAARECRKDLRGKLDRVVADLSNGTVRLAGIITIKG